MSVFFFNDTATTEIYTLSLHDALPILRIRSPEPSGFMMPMENCPPPCLVKRSEEHTSELQSHLNLVCRLLLEKKEMGALLYARRYPLHVACVILLAPFLGSHILIAAGD